MRNEGRLVGIDVNGKRLEGALAAARAHGVTIVEAVEGDLTAMEPHGDFFGADAVLLDAPCSGLGVLTRRPDLRWRREEGSLAELTVLQDRLLDVAAGFVRPGGRLVYATCTITEEENEARVEAFLSRHPEFEESSVEGSVPSAVMQAGRFATLPHVHGIDGAFAARLIRRS
jgi:16S rRNA (cytosine967-C5)-methyltransferase